MEYCVFIASFFLLNLPINTIAMASSISSLPLQGDTASSQAAAVGSSTTSSPSSGSLGPFFAVISVLTFLAVVSCVVGRICVRRRTKGAAVVAITPLDTIKHGGWLGWLKLRCGGCMAGEVVEAGAKVMSFGEDQNNNETHPHPPPV
ncbi:hypothetical protein ERO13_D03G100500v2 [Gossypium hirsutum]|uniref:Transmembrane protein n=7 Tax=Gossypium TaxID=3633 RepID=A0A1U8NLU7_GOSHI|nr:uncharacterized protein LOC105788514 [Gossypium raimondii]XP_016739986.1 uncharacterized protein LOC107949743 [Gossypium hirsutum]MBA0707728.1 hypothetical protein [Gossypium laxum]TYH80364.1 hypothetical protein ES332_D03G127100v1 [Gossypium tomentosum]TYI90339.1 hypothetical protein E1A91_D03G115200v1 [Gossypium mustelinum]KAG4155254.1 hypothetical protein ERO13_D03G100500v2 [Gossypium hirsutum]KJB19494.1 hypothetical protein B456_003G106000 [Gossypium raimondii]